MLTKDDILRFLIDNKDKFRKEYRIQKIGLFGSYASSTNTEHSDIDLLVEFDSEVDIFETKLKLQELFRNQMQKEADICREKYLNRRARKKILDEVIYV